MTDQQDRQYTDLLQNNPISNETESNQLAQTYRSVDPSTK